MEETKPADASDNGLRQEGKKEKGKKRESARRPGAKPGVSDSKRPEAEETAAYWRDLYLRLAAEVDNFKKRTIRETGQNVLFANAELMKTILPVIDDLERSLKYSGETTTDEFRTGVGLIHKKLLSALMGAGLEAMDAVGKPFDVDEHDALLQMEKEGVDPGVVLEEHEKGYRLHGKVIRHAKVVVSK